LGTAGLSGAQVEAGKQGEMSLSRFVAALEARISAEQNMHSVMGKETAGRPTAGAVGEFLEKIASEQAGSQGKVSSPPVVEHRQEKQGPMWDTRQAAEKVITGANGKDSQEQITQAAARQTSSGGHTGGNAAENSAGKDETAKFMNALTAAGKEKVRKTGEQNLSAADSFLKAAKSADEISTAIKTPAGKTLPGYLLDQVSRQIVKLRTAGENEITLQLKPPHLGRMKLNVEHTSGGIKVGIVVESAAAKEMLLSHANELKAALGDQGLRLDKIDVETQSDFGRSMAQAGREFGQSGGQGGRRNGGGPMRGTAAREERITPGMVREVDSGRLYLVA
jgi:flagellar hook-length control protein FliK